MRPLVPASRRNWKSESRKEISITSSQTYDEDLNTHPECKVDTSEL